MDTELPPLGPLEHDDTAGACIIGARITGLSTAYMLSRLDCQVRQNSFEKTGDGPCVAEARRPRHAWPGRPCHVNSRI